MSGTCKIAVTGASGFIGTFLVPAMIRQGMEATLLTRSAADVLAQPNININPGDLLDQESLRSLVNGMDAVLHLAGYAHASGRPNPSEIALHRRINLEGTQKLFQCAAQAGVHRFVFVSSVKAGGEHPHECLDESSVLTPQDPYGQIKRQTEDWLFEEGRRYGMEVCVLRPALIYGPGVKGNLAAMLRGIDRGWFPPIPETHNIRSMVSVQDVVTALLAAVTSTEAAGQVCILTDGEAYSSRRIYAAMAAALAKPVRTWTFPVALLRCLGVLGDFTEVLVRRQLPINGRLIGRLLDSACYRSKHAITALAFKPRNRLEDVLPEMVAAYRGSTFSR